jgi:Ca-activated chloride channel family protein
MKKYILLAILLPGLTVGQEDKKIKGNITSKDVNISILGVYQDDFPNVSVVFRAEKSNGNPVFGLKKKDMTVKENDENCQVISIQELSKQKPINIGIVLDHSGSMQFDERQINQLGYDISEVPMDDYGYYSFPKGYVQPITLAKNALLEFVESFNFDKDNIGVVGFSSTVDYQLGLTNQSGKIKRKIRSMKSDGSTAFYDAILASLKQVENADGVNVVVALTDGNDNSSYSNINTVINKAKSVDIPVYIVGLGDVNQRELEQLATATGGQFYFANSAKSLSLIYEKISEKLQSFYDIVYQSPTLENNSTERSIEISFLNEGTKVVSEEERYILDSNAVVYVTKKQAEALQKAQEEAEFIKAEKLENERQMLVNGGIGIMALLVSGGIIFYFARRTSKTSIHIAKVFPNPSAGNVTVEISNAGQEQGKLHVFDLQGNQVHEQPIGNLEEVDLSRLANGTYILKGEFGDKVTEGVKVIVQK